MAFIAHFPHNLILKEYLCMKTGIALVMHDIGNFCLFMFVQEELLHSWVKVRIVFQIALAFWFTVFLQLVKTLIQPFAAFYNGATFKHTVGFRKLHLKLLYLQPILHQCDHLVVEIWSFKQNNKESGVPYNLQTTIYHKRHMALFCR